MDIAKRLKKAEKAADVGKADVLAVAKSLKMEPLTDEQIIEVLEYYPCGVEQDPTGGWDLVIEQCFYDCGIKS